MSIRKISKELGLSSATVSWILSGKGEEHRLKEETIKRVQEYAKKINYRPNLVARNLSNGSTQTIGVIIPYISDTYFATIAQEIENQANLHSYGLTICSSGGNIDRELELTEIMLNQRVDGIILASAGETGCETPSIKKLKENNCPFVLIDRYSDVFETNYVVPNNFHCSCDLTMRIASQGATKIAIVTSDSQLSAMSHRFEGYKQGLKRSNLEFNEELVIDIDRLNYKERGIELIEALLDKQPDIDGLFFTTHYLALNGIKYFVDKKIDYNTRFNMATIYNSTWLKLLAPNINIASVPLREISQQAVEILCDNIKNKEKSSIKQIVISNTII